MHPFFHGWRRKAGVMSLVMALALFSFRNLTTRYEIESCCELGGLRSLIHADGGILTWYCWKDAVSGGFDIRIRIADKAEGSYLFSNLGFVIVSPIRLRLSSAWMACLFGLLSGYLILIPSRKQQPTAGKTHE